MEPKAQPSAADVFGNPWHFIAFGFGSGLAPIGPGTFGTIVGVGFFLLFAMAGPLAYLLLTLAAFAVGVLICERSSALLGVHDHSGIVWDEVVGYLITMLPLLFLSSWFAGPQWKWLLIGFVVFRVFDIAKPWPISVADRNVHGGFGIMFDDALAGLASAATMILLGVLLGQFI